MNKVPQEIRVVDSASAAWDSVRALVAAGSRPAEVNLAAYADEDAFVDDLVRIFEIPYPMGGVPGAIDWLSDLDWLERANGHVVVLDEWDQARADVADAALAVATHALDRWRSGDGRQPYVVAIVSRDCRPKLLVELARYNDLLEDFGRAEPVSGSRAVPIVIAD